MPAGARSQQTLFALDGPADPIGTVAEFFAGIGLARLGFEQAGWRVDFANDLDPAKHAMYETHFGPSPHYALRDIHEIADDPDVAPDVDLAHASFPCTDLSLAGARRGIRAGQSSAYWGFHRWLDRKGERRPRLVLLENVTGFLTSHAGRDFHDALVALNDLGYAVDPFVVDAAHFVPQSRPRLFVVGVRDASGDSVVAPSELAPSATRPAAVIDAIGRFGDVTWSLRALPRLPERGGTRIESIIDDPPDDDPQWWSAERADYLLSQMSERHRAVADDMIADDRDAYGAVFRRVRKGRSMAELRTDGLAGCLRTPKGGSGRQILFRAGGGRHMVRLFNARECARLMGADGYRVDCRLNQALFGFGDAVCVNAIEWITRHYLTPVMQAASKG